MEHEKVTWQLRRQVDIVLNSHYFLEKGFKPAASLSRSWLRRSGSRLLTSNLLSYPEQPEQQTVSSREFTHHALKEYRCLEANIHLKRLFSLSLNSWIIDSVKYQCVNRTVLCPASPGGFRFNWFWTGFTGNCPHRFYIMYCPDRGGTSGPGPLEPSSTGNINYAYFTGWATEGTVSCFPWQPRAGSCCSRRIYSNTSWWPPAPPLK